MAIRIPSPSEEEQAKCHVYGHVTAVVHLRVINANVKATNQLQDLQVT